MKQIKYIVLSLLLLTSTAGCGIYSTYQRNLDQEVVDTLYDYIEATSDTSNIANIAWREIFTDPALQSLIERGLESNTDLRVAKLDVDQAEASLRASRLAFFPSLSAGAQSSIVSGGDMSSNVSLTSSWEIDLFGRLRNASKASKAALEQSVAYRQGVQTQLIATIAGSYYSLLMLDEQLRISEQTQINWEENLRVMEALKRAGRINETALLQSQASSVALSSQIVTIKESIAVLENSISLLLASPTKHIERGSITNVEFPESLSVGLPIELITSRPDVRVAEAQLAEAFYLTSEAKSSLYPSITLSGAAIYSGEDIVLSATGALLQPIFNRGALRSQVAISEAQAEQALLEFNQAILEAAAEVNDAVGAYQSAQKRLEYSSEQISLLERAVKNTELLMKHGSSNYLDVLTAQLALLQSELSLASDRYNQTQSVINLYRALGGGEF